MVTFLAGCSLMVYNGYNNRDSQFAGADRFFELNLVTQFFELSSGPCLRVGQPTPAFMSTQICTLSAKDLFDVPEESIESEDAVAEEAVAEEAVAEETDDGVHMSATEELVMPSFEDSDDEQTLCLQEDDLLNSGQDESKQPSPTNLDGLRVLRSFFRTPTNPMTTVRADSMTNLSFNYLINRGLQTVIDRLSIVSSPVRTIEFGRIVVGTPDQTPYMARKTSTTYNAQVYVDVTEYVREKSGEGGEVGAGRMIRDGSQFRVVHHRQVPLFKMPIALQSAACRLFGKTEEQIIEAGESAGDVGDYFIVAGGARVLLPQRGEAYNKHHAVRVTDPKSKFQTSSRVRSISAETNHSAEIYAQMSRDGHVSMTIPRVKDTIPPIVLFRAMGLTTADVSSMFDLLKHPDESHAIIYRRLLRECSDVKTEQDAIRYIGQRLIEKPRPAGQAAAPAVPGINSETTKHDNVAQMVKNEILPHYGVTATNKFKVWYLIDMIVKLVNTDVGFRPVDTPDELTSKRISTANALVTELFRNLFKKFILKLKAPLERPQVCVPSMITQFGDDLTKGLEGPFSNGEWGVRGSYSIPGVVQVDSRLSHIDHRSLLNRIADPPREGANSSGRQVLSSEHGFFCHHHVPEGERCGCIRPKTIMANVSVAADPIVFMSTLENKCSSFVLLEGLMDGVNSKTSEAQKALIAQIVGTGGEAAASVAETAKALKILGYRFKVFHNNQLIGLTRDWKRTRSELMALKARGEFESGEGIHISISYQFVDGDVRIYTNEGRMIRPVFNVENGRLTLEQIPGLMSKIRSGQFQWEDLIKVGAVRYIDPAEQELEYIATSITNLYHESPHARTVSLHRKQIPDRDLQIMYGNNPLKLQIPDGAPETWTSCEIDPSALMSVAASTIPWSNHNQGPRVSFASGMLSQAFGSATSNPDDRFDTSQLLLWYPQRPITSTSLASMSGQHKRSASQNVSVAVATWLGYTIEDAIVVKDQFAQRGGLAATKRICITVSCERLTDVEIKYPPENSPPNVRLGDPDYFCRNRNGNYSMLLHRRTRKDADGNVVPVPNMLGEIVPPELDGVIRKGSKVREGDVLVGMVKSSGKMGFGMTDASRLVASGEEGVVRKVWSFRNQSGYQMVKILIDKEVQAEKGNKGSSRHGQKGTFSIIAKAQDMPFDAETGMIPDLIINPQAFPSRMTSGQTSECGQNEISLRTGEFGDATPFTGLNERKNLFERLVADLKQAGLVSAGYRTMCDGTTGIPFRVEIFCGMTSYMALKHIVMSKMHARATGPVTSLYRQPPEGRSRKGGLRLGEMETMATLAHGAALLIVERLRVSSDDHVIQVCADCGVMANTRTRCQRCKSGSIVNVGICYATKVLVQELEAMGIKIMFRVEGTFK